MNNFTKKIKGFLDKYKGYISCIIACSIIVFASMYQCQNTTNMQEENKIDDHNIKAYQDSLRIYKVENGKLLAAKTMYIMKLSELQKQLGISKSTISSMQDTLKSQLELLAKVESNIKVDTVHTNNIIVVDKQDTLINNFDYKDQWLSFHGQSRYIHKVFETDIHNISMDAPLIIGMTKNYQFTVLSENPYLHVTDIKAGYIEKPKEKRIHIGWGVGMGTFYDLMNKKFGYGPSIMIGVTYKLW